MQIDDKITDDTLWEINSCWQDALSTGDIPLTDDLLQKCSTQIRLQLGIDEGNNKAFLTLDRLEKLSESTYTFLLCSIECCDSAEQKLQFLDSRLGRIFTDIQCEEGIKYIEEMCLFLESINESSIVPKHLNATASQIDSFAAFNRATATVMEWTMFTFNVMTKIVNVTDRANAGEPGKDSKTVEGEPIEMFTHIWSKRILEKIIQSMCVSCMANCLQEHSNDVSLETSKYDYVD